MNACMYVCMCVCVRLKCYCMCVAMQLTRDEHSVIRHVEVYQMYAACLQLVVHDTTVRLGLTPQQGMNPQAFPVEVPLDLQALILEQADAQRREVDAKQRYLADDAAVGYF